MLPGSLILLIAGLAHGADSGLFIDHVWARPTPPGVTVGVVYLELKNRGTSPDRLLRLATPLATAVQLHETREEHGLMSMRQLPFLDVPAGGMVKASPGALHIMLLGLNKPLLDGDTFPLTMLFGAAGALTVQVRVRTDR